MSITSDFNILFLVCKGYLVIRAYHPRQVTPRTVMNTKVYIILESLLDSIGIIKEILKEHKGVHMRVNDSSGLLT